MYYTSSFYIVKQELFFFVNATATKPRDKYGIIIQSKQIVFVYTYILIKVFFKKYFWMFKLYAAVVRITKLQIKYNLHHHR